MNFNIQFLILFQLIIINISADELIIKVSGQTNAGILNLGIYNNAEAYDQSVNGEERSEKGVFSGIDSYIELKESHEFIINLPEGTYAIALFIDANENLKIDKNFLGIPKEQYGFSNNVMGKLSGPSFEQAKFQVKGSTVQNIKLK
tara:strand:- start:148 stop:585 length:438 start_codon:yes stop_codon:yes gene_type:complete